MHTVSVIHKSAFGMCAGDSNPTQWTFSFKNETFSVRKTRCFSRRRSSCSRRRGLSSHCNDFDSKSNSPFIQQRKTCDGLVIGGSSDASQTYHVLATLCAVRLGMKTQERLNMRPFLDENSVQLCQPRG